MVRKLDEGIADTSTSFEHSLRADVPRRSLTLSYFFSSSISYLSPLILRNLNIYRTNRQTS